MRSKMVVTLRLCIQPFSICKLHRCSRSAAESSESSGSASARQSAQGQQRAVSHHRRGMMTPDMMQMIGPMLRVSRTQERAAKNLADPFRGFPGC